MKTEILIQQDATRLELLLPLAADVFDDFEPAYIEERLPYIVEPVLVIARDEHGPAGFKLGYRQDTSFYSWLGGTHPRARRQGIAAYLMKAQHDHVGGLGYRSIVTRTRASNRSMVILNLKSGFEIVGFEINAAGFAVVNQRKSLIDA